MRIIKTVENQDNGDITLHVEQDDLVMTFSKEALCLAVVTDVKVLVGSYIGVHDVKYEIYSQSTYCNCLMQFLINSLFLSLQDQQDLGIDHDDDAKHWPLWTL